MFATMTETQTVWRGDLGTFVAVAEACEPSVDGWCMTHSSGAGPAWCEPASAHPWPSPA